MGSFESVQLGIQHTISTINTTLNKTFQWSEFPYYYVLNYVTLHVNELANKIQNSPFKIINLTIMFLGKTPAVL